MSGDVLTVVIVAVGALLSVLFIFANKKLLKLIDEKIKNETAKRFLGVVTNRAFAVVKDLSESVVKELKNRAADGKLTAQDVAEVNKKALENLKTQVGDAVIGDAKKALGLDDAQIDKVLDSTIKAAVLDTKAAVEPLGK